MSKIVRISDLAYSKLDLLETQLGVSRQAIIDAALERLVREHMLSEANKAYALSGKVDVSEWDVTLQDGLEDL